MCVVFVCAFIMRVRVCVNVCVVCVCVCVCVCARVCVCYIRDIIHNIAINNQKATLQTNMVGPAYMGPIVL